MSGIVYDDERPFAPVVNDRLRTVLTNHNGQSDAHLSFPYLGILGEPMLKQYIAFDRPVTDNFGAAGVIYKKSTASQANRSWIEFQRDSSNNLIVNASSQMMWMLKYPFPAGGQGFLSPYADVVVSLAGISDYTARGFTGNGDSVVPSIAYGGSPSAMTGHGDVSKAVTFKFWGLDNISNATRYVSAHYLFHTDIRNLPTGYTPNYSNPVKFYTDINHGTMGMMHGNGTWPLYVWDTGSQQESSSTSWHKFLIDPNNSDWFRCTRFTDKDAFPSTCPSDGKMLAYMRFDMQSSESTSYISTTAPTVGLDLSGFTYKSDAPGATLHVDLDYAFLFYGTKGNGWIYDNDGYMDNVQTASISMQPSEREDELFSNVGGLNIRAKCEYNGPMIRLRSATGSAIRVNKLTMVAKAKSQYGGDTWERDNTKTITTAFDIPVGDNTTFYYWYNYPATVASNTSKTYLKAIFELSNGKKLTFEINSSGGITLRLKCIEE